MRRPFYFMPELETERLLLRLYAPPDKKHLVELFTDETVMRYVDKGVCSVEEAEALWRKLLDDFYPQGKNTIFAVFSKDANLYIGHAAIRPRPAKKEDWEITYFLKTDAWGKGFATETVKRLIEFGFEDLNLPEVFATIDDENSSSIKVVEKAGMSFLRHEFDEDGRFSVYSIKKQ